jgi:phage terminase large subunit GpA-like protein
MHGQPWSVHFPAALRSETTPHLWFEQLFAERRDKGGEWNKIHAGIRNEAMDLMVLSHAVARLHGIGRINWSDPPAWAAPWERNSMIIDLPAPVAETAATPIVDAPAAPGTVAVPPSTAIAKDEAERLRALMRKFR